MALAVAPPLTGRRRSAMLPNRRATEDMSDPSPPLSRPDTLRRLRDRASEARNDPGVYRFTGVRGEVLYVGKSVALRRRLLSYFRPAGRSKEWELVRVAAGVEWEYLPNELEALLREYRLIRTFRPRFNSRHRRLRRYAWIRLTPGPLPRLRATRTPVPDGSRYFGPFPAPAGLPDLLGELERTVGLDAGIPGTAGAFSGQLDLLAGERGTGGLAEERVRARAAAVVRFLEARDDGPLEEIRRRITSAARNHRYELAARLRDREMRLRALRDEVAAFRDALGKLSCIYRPPGSDAAGDGQTRGYLLSQGRVVLRFPCPSVGIPAEGIGEHIRALASASPLPPDALGATEREEAFVVTRWFRANPGSWEHTLPVERFLTDGA